MHNRSFRFVHAADFHLEQVPQDVAHVPDHLKDLFVDAAYRAAERVFDTACHEHVDFVVLAGNLLDPTRTGPRGPLFLVEQFEKLAERGMPVYWAGGTIDSPDLWPPTVTLPPNVVVFPMGRPDEVVFDRDAEPVVRLVGASRTSGRRLRPDEYAGEAGGMFTIGVAHGGADPQAMKRREIEYWALGGQRIRKTLFRGPETAHYPGTPQGRSPHETGDFGCTLVEVDGSKTVRTSHVSTSNFRWHQEQIEIEPSHSQEHLAALLRQRMATISETHAATDVMISWTVEGSGPLMTAIRRGPLAEDLLSMLRREFGFGPPPLWSLTLQADAVLDVPQSRFDEDSIRGDFLKAIRDLTESPKPIDLSDHLPERYLAGSLSTAAEIADAEDRARVLAEAAMLGVDLLTAEEAQS